MSSGEGAEETTKDASDIAAFFKTEDAKGMSYPPLALIGVP